VHLVRAGKPDWSTYDMISSQTLKTDAYEAALRVVELLDGRTIATAESCTAGRVAETLASVESAATFLRGGVVAYQEESKRSLLGVTAESVFTRECACEMAEGAAQLFDADVTVSTTGVAGNETTEGTPPGTVYIGTFVQGRRTASSHRFAGTPEQVCDQARVQALVELAKVLGEADR
jgi:nicotinamide-nucleotide amidase